MSVNYYQENAQTYFSATIAMTMVPVLKRFAAYLQPGGHVLDVGCGSGRDSRWFIDHGFQLTAVDACPELAVLATNYIGQEVIVGDYHRLAYADEFTAIWACASLVHCPKAKMPAVLQRLITALKSGGYLYISLKDGDGEAVDKDGRFFSYYTLAEFTQVVAQLADVDIVEAWENSMELRGSQQVWVNVIVRKQMDK
jgi:SAM-dependent methyltransferase